MNILSSLRIAGLALLLCAGGVAAQPAGAGLAREIERVLAFEHGLDRLGPEQRPHLEALLRDPAATVAALRQHLPAPNAAGLGTPGALHRYGRAIALLGRLDHPDASALLGEWFARLREPSARGDDDAIRLRRAALNAFATRASPAVTASLLDEIERLDYGTRVTALGYLARVERGNPVVRERLQRLARDPRSPLHKDAATLGTLRALGGGGP